MKFFVEVRYLDLKNHRSPEFWDLKGFSENLRKVNCKFVIDRFGQFWQFQCKLECKRTQNIFEIVQ